MPKYNLSGIHGITLYITENCNLNCSYCFLPKRNGKAVDEGVAYKSIDFLFDIVDKKDLSFAYITLFGGEPLLEKEMIKKIVEYGNKKSENYDIPLLYNIVTNGTLLDDDFIQYMGNDNFAILLSWDGMPKSQDLYRKNKNGVGFSSKIERMVPILSDKLLNFSVRMTFSPDTVIDLYDNIKYIAEKGLSNIGFVPTYEQHWTEEDLEVFENQLNKIVDFFIDNFNNGRIFIFQPLLDFILSVDHNYSSTHVNHFYIHPCHMDTLAIDVNGYIYPCHRFVAFDKKCSYILGNVLEDNFSHEKYNDYMITRERLRKDFPKDGGCPAVNYDTNGEVLSINKNFKMFRIRFENAIQKIIKQKNYEEILKVLKNRKIVRIEQ